MAECQYCESTVRDDRTLCPVCTAFLHTLLSQVPGILEELDVALTRQARLRPVKGAAVLDAVELPYNLSAAEAARNIRTMLLPWVRVVHVGTGAPYQPKTSTAALARGLWNWRAWLSRHHEAGRLLTELTGVVEDVRRIIDTRVEKVFVGSCRSIFNSEGERQHACPEHMYAPARNVEFTCGKCGTVHHVKTRQQQAIAASENRVLPPQTIARALTRNGEALSVERLYNWVKRGLLKPAAIDPTSKRKLYRVGDVRDVMIATDASPNNPRKALTEMRDAA